MSGFKILILQGVFGGCVFSTIRATSKHPELSKKAQKIQAMLVGQAWCCSVVASQMAIFIKQESVS